MKRNRSIEVILNDYEKAVDGFRKAVDQQLVDLPYENGLRSRKKAPLSKLAEGKEFDPKRFNRK